jgi:hypothetical protein
MTIEFINRDISTAEGWNTFVAGVREFFHEQAAKDEYKLTDVTLVLTCDPVTGEPYKTPGLHVLATVFGGATREQADEEKNAFELVIRAWATAGRAIAAIFTSETWFTIVKPLPGGKMPDNVTAPSEDPNRQEMLVVTVEHKTFGNEVFSSLITHKDGARALAPWSGGRSAKEQGGRFTGLIPSDEILRDTNAVVSARAFVSAIGGANALRPAKGRVREPNA